MTPLQHQTTWFRSVINGLVVALLCAFPVIASSQPAPSAPVIELDGPSDGPAALFVQALLERAYADIGYQVTYRDLPLGRSFIEANAGRLDGLRARVGTVAFKYPNLVKVPFVLLEFKLAVIADRRVCGLCELDQINRFVVPRGLKAFEDIKKSGVKLEDAFEVTSNEQAVEMVRQGKMEAAIVSDLNLPPDFRRQNPHMIMQTIAILPDFHFLNNKHAPLADSVYQALLKLDKQGVVATLRKKYGIAEPETEGPELPTGQVTAVSGNWLGFTDSDAGTYWRILGQIYNQTDMTFHHEVASWKRAKQLFGRGNVDLLVGAYDFEVLPDMLRSDAHIDYEIAVSAFAADEQRLKALLDNKEAGTACFEAGYDFHQWLPQTLTNYEVSDFRDCERLLSADRVDLMVGYALDVAETVRESFVSREVSEAKPLFVVFRDTPRGRLLKARFEQQFRQMVRNGVVADMFPDKEQYQRASLQRISH